MRFKAEFKKQLDSIFQGSEFISETLTEMSDGLDHRSFVKDEGDKLVAAIPLPGVKPETITLVLESDHRDLTVQYEKAGKSTKHTLTLPCLVLIDGVEAILENGELTVTLKKADKAGFRLPIPVKISDIKV